MLFAMYGRFKPGVEEKRQESTSAITNTRANAPRPATSVANLR